MSRTTLGRPTLRGRFRYAPHGDSGPVLAGGGSITLSDRLVRVLGDVAYECGREQGDFTMAGHDVHIDHRVTNVYQREGGT